MLLLRTMKKNEYITPEMEVVEVKYQTALLAGSDTEGSGEGSIDHGEDF